MIDAAMTWDYRRMYDGPSPYHWLYLLFLLLACIVGVAKLLRVWWVAPPFRLSRMKDRPAYLDKLAAAGASLQRWIVAAFFSWAILVSSNVVNVGQRILEQREPWGASILIVIISYSEALSRALLVALLLYLIRWHLLKRIERLRK